MPFYKVSKVEDEAWVLTTYPKEEYSKKTVEAIKAALTAMKSNNFTEAYKDLLNAADFCNRIRKGKEKVKF